MDTHDFGVVLNLRITGADMKYWSDSQGRAGGDFYWKFDSGAATEVIWSQTYLGPAQPNNYQGTTSYAINLLTGLTPGAHTLSIWAKSWDGGGGQGDSWLSNGGNNYVANFTVIPEPSTMLLVGAGLMSLVALRRRKA